MNRQESPKMARKILGIRKVVSEVRAVPHGFHVEIWGYKTEQGDIQLYTSEYLSQNSWTIGHDEGEVDITLRVYTVMDWDGVSMTEAIKRTVAEVWKE